MVTVVDKDKGPPKIIILKGIKEYSSSPLALSKLLHFLLPFLIPVSSSSESGESPIMSNHDGMAMFIFNVTGITGACGQMYLMWALLILAKASAHPCAVSPNP